MRRPARVSGAQLPDSGLYTILAVPEYNYSSMGPQNPIPKNKAPIFNSSREKAARRAVAPLLGAVVLLGSARLCSWALPRGPEALI